MRLRSCFSFILAAGICSGQTVPQTLFDQMRWRNIGPFRGGRVIAVTGVPGDPTTFYFGSVGGGVWKTTDAGTVWNPIFDHEHIASIGAIAVAPSDSSVVYVGSGEADMRSQIGFGDGVYKSTDAGKTWRNVGLRDTRQISAIRVDPRDANTVYVAALGHAYGPNDERGVFRSTDGGATWQKVLFTNPEVGAADLALDPQNPKTLYAALWNGRRSQWSQYPPIEGPGSGLYKTTDGGDHWTQLQGHGLPEGRWGRSGVAVAPGGQRVYAEIDIQGSAGIYRSDDGGATWTHASSDSRITSRAWYFSGITVDPKDPDAVYVPNVGLYKSTDGAKTFTVLKGAPGGDDYHILWVDPAEPRRMILGVDQGATISLDGGATWTTWYNQPTAQIYHVITDNQFPYVVYGSQQDSGTAAVVSRTDHGEIDARDWFSVGGAESGYIAIDGKDPNILYVSDTVGTLSRFDKRTGQAQNITPWPVRSGGPMASISAQKYRFPWTAPLVSSRTEPGTIYYGAQMLLKSSDGGLNWREISGDLTGDTRKDRTPAQGTPTAEEAIARGYGVIYAIAPSPLKAGLIWVGSDTGLIHLTRDGGKTWENVTPKGLASWSKASQIEASHFDPAVAYVTIDRHRMEDYKPYIYRTADYGKTWTLITTGLEEPAYLNGIREDPARKGLLYVATELGVAVSFDNGGHWQPLQLNLPVTSVRDLTIHGDDLVIATHGRGFWILDDITPLRQIGEQVTSADAFLYKPAAAIRMNPQAFMGTPLPPEEPKAKNPPDGAIIDYYLKDAPAGEVTLEILDGKGQVVRQYSSKPGPEARRRPGSIADYWLAAPEHLTAHAGMNRFVWDLRFGAPAGEDESEFEPAPAGPQVLPGTYQVKLTAAGRTYTQPLAVKLDPRSTATPQDLAKQLELSLNIMKALARASAAGRRAIVRELTAALGVAESADRTPPATAYQIYDQALKELSTSAR